MSRTGKTLRIIRICDEATVVLHVVGIKDILSGLMNTDQWTSMLIINIP
jgi:hypothetical protein